MVRCVLYNIKSKLFFKIYPLFFLKGERKVSIAEGCIQCPLTQTLKSVLAAKGRATGASKMGGKLRLFANRYETPRYEVTVLGKDFNLPSNLECFRAKESALYLPWRPAFLSMEVYSPGHSWAQSALRRGSLLEAGFSVGQYDQTALLSWKKKKKIFLMINICFKNVWIPSVSKRFG